MALASPGHSKVHLHRIPEGEENQGKDHEASSNFLFHHYFRTLQENCFGENCSAREEVRQQEDETIHNAGEFSGVQTFVEFGREGQ